MTKPKARIKIGQHFMGEKTSLTAEGVVLYKEWDAEDHKNYYWEEWELRGFNTIDSWIEYDHYTKKTTRYVPLRTTQTDDLTTLATKQKVVVQAKDGPVETFVHEAGAGIVDKIHGTFSYHLFKGDTVRYAELHGLGANASRRFSVEVYNDKEFDVYEGEVLSRYGQKRLLGRTVEPIVKNWGAVLGILFWIPFIGLFLWASFAPRTERVCTPRTVTSPSGVTSTEQHCTTRTVYGSGGSGGGIGK